MSIQESWLDFKDKRFINFFYKPLLIYGKQFFKIILFSLIVEFIFFGIFQLIIFNVGVEYSEITGHPFLTVQVDFVSDFGRAFFFILFIFTIVLFFLRSTLISNTSRFTIEKGKVNIVQVIENSILKIKEISIFTVFVLTMLFIPIIMITVAIIIMVREFQMAFAMLIFAIIVPYLICPKISLFTAGMAKDNLHVGTALQTSWNLTGGRNWFRTSFLFVFYSIVSFLGPWALTAYLNQRYAFIYLGLVMVFVRAFLFPLYDITMTYLYMHYDFNALEISAFKEDILEQRKRSEEFTRKIKSNNVKDL
ncbi:MAG: hypothetical protein FK730_11270 [Asgard group archaeon]|nr:hypothetical protein [Asgard group archaeon]